MLFLAGISVDCPCQKFRTSTYNSCYWNVIYNILLSLVQLTHLYKQLIINLITVFTTTDGILSTECMMRQLFSSFTALTRKWTTAMEDYAALIKR